MGGKKNAQDDTLQRKLARRRLHKPNYIIYRILTFVVVKLMFEKKFRVTYTRKVNPRDFKAPFIVVSNHASRLDYIFTSLALLPHTLNYVAGYNEFFRSHLSFIFRLMQVIPKKNFVSDIYTIKEIKRVINDGGNIMLFPEGMSSISGSNQPCALASGKMLKRLGLPVLRTGISGGYLTSTKYCLDERAGRVDVELDLLFTPEQLAEMTEDEVQAKLDAAIHHDDYEWNKTARVKFDGQGQMAKNLHDMLYWCPKCGAEFTMRGEGDKIVCTSCGNGAELNEYYDLTPLDDTCVIPDTPRVWWDMQRENARDLVKDENFLLREHVKLGTLPKFKYLKEQKTSEITGEGVLTLDRRGLRFDGTRDGAPFSFAVDAKNLPTYGMCTDMTQFYTFVNGEFLEFFPDGRTVAKWLLTTEENHRIAGGAWRDFD
ncbi:MAG: 1-acyl-sn-glycerol-3-phosphate acyltransferase [Oscillospiraceae bacterium]|jgi:1-acyl-sn-glycerol-3-phosphate acyltransferase|nr:1-acyl-sn-glycerol-3-phosphate acyltransferase [Oscillospiraceae bacterium]